MPDTDVSPYARHSRWTEPGGFADLLRSLPAEPAGLPELVGGLVLHPLFLRDGLASREPQLRSVRDIVGAILGKDPRPLTEMREPDKRVLGTCRNYALLACAILREHRIPARLRVGFADYFTPAFAEDHWVCEYYHGDVWRLLDAELTRETQRQFGIAFDPAAVPRDRFLAAGPAWLALRRGERDPARFGVSAIGIAGFWFVASSLLRDVAALNREEMMPWDFWGPARDLRPDAEITPDCLVRFDRLADALAREPQGSDDASSIAAEFPWTALTPSVLSFPQGKPVEVLLAA